MKKAGAEMLEDFSSFSGSKFSDSYWKSRNGNPSTIYSFVKEGDNTFLEARTVSNSVQLFRKKGWNIKENPILSWKWRIREFPYSDTKHVVKNDNAVGIYVVFPARWFMPETIKYIWNSDLQKDRLLRKKDNFPAIVIRAGKDKQGEWVTEERNVYEDYKKLFGRNPPNPVAFGFLSDSDDSKSKSIGDYDSFEVLAQPRPVPVTAPKPEKIPAKPAVKKPEEKTAAKPAAIVPAPKK
ncbi:MAG: DUF3047 domain-containing protein [Bdellovibrionota bacterium]